MNANRVSQANANHWAIGDRAEYGVWEKGTVVHIDADDGVLYVQDDNCIDKVCILSGVILASAMNTNLESMLATERAFHAGRSGRMEVGR